MKKLLLSTALLVTYAGFAFAGGPEHFRLAGCDPDTMRPVTNSAGEILYWQGGDCTSLGGGATPAPLVVPIVDDGDDDPVVDDGGDDGEEPGDDNGDDTSGGNDDEPGDDNGGESGGSDDNGDDSSEEPGDNNGDDSSEEPVFDIDPIAVSW